MAWSPEAVSNVMTAPPPSSKLHMSSVLIIGGGGRLSVGLVGSRRGGNAPLLPELGEQVGHLAEPVQRQQMHGRLLGCRDARVIGRTQREGGMGAVWELDNEVGISPLPDADDHYALAAQGVMWMGDGDRFRKQLGQWGRVL
jgi:hypothetical protein